MSLPNTATIKERHDEQKRRAKFNEHEGARLTKELDEDGTIERVSLLQSFFFSFFVSSPLIFIDSDRVY